MRKQRHDIDRLYNCPVEAALDLFGGKWKGVILFHLSYGTKRFGELSKLLTKISPRVLTKQLRDLEDDGLVHRKVFAQVPPKVEYSLTEQGQTLTPILVSLQDWGNSHVLRRLCPTDKSI